MYFESSHFTIDEYFYAVLPTGSGKLRCTWRAFGEILKPLKLSSMQKLISMRRIISVELLLSIVQLLKIQGGIFFFAQVCEAPEVHFKQIS